MFYIPGYDPMHPRRYREMYRREGAAQAAISGYEIALTPRKTPRPSPGAPGGEGPPRDDVRWHCTSDGYGWDVSARIEGAEVAAGIEVLVWSDIVRASMVQGIAATYGQLLRTAWTYLGTGTLARLMRLRKGPMIAALYPLAMLSAQLLLAVGLAGLAGALAAQLHPALWLIALPVAVLALRWFRARDGHLYAYYLTHQYAFVSRDGGACPAALEARLSAFADAIAGALAEEVDEVLVVGHSAGAHLAVSVLADLIRAGRVPGGGPALGLLTLGHVVPMVSFLPGAQRLRADLRLLSGSDDLAWVDVTAPGDGGCFALCDPVAVTGVAPPGKRWPLVISAAFRQTLSAETWAQLRWRFFRLHFQYLCAFDRPGDYDYFRITAGPRTLGDRFAGRAPSASRVERAVSRHTSVAA